MLLWGHGEARDEVCAFDVDSGGGLTPSWCYELPGVMPHGSPPHILTGHFGADGEAGFAVRGVGEVVVVTNPGDVPTEHRLPLGIGPGGQIVFIAADLDCDRRDELLGFGEEGQLLGYAAPWRTPRTISTNGEPSQVWAADIDADGCDDLLSHGVLSDGPELELYASTGVHTTLALNLSHRLYVPEVADLDADGHDDFLLTDNEGTLVYWGDSLVQDDPGRAELIESMALNPFSWFDVVDVNGDGADDLLTLFQDDTWTGELNPVRMSGTLLSVH